MAFQHSVAATTAKDFQFVHPQEAVLFDPTIQPSKVPGHIIHLKMRRKLWRLQNDSFGVRHVDGRPFEANVKGAVFSFRDRMVLRNLKGEPIGIMLKMFGRWERTFKIYGCRPLIAGQKPSQQTSEDGRPLFAWAEVKDLRLSVRYTMTTTDGNVYVADRVGPLFGKMKMKLTRNDITCALIQHEAFFSGITGPVWDLQIAPGIDPCLLLCFTAIVDEMQEDSR